MLIWKLFCNGALNLTNLWSAVQFWTTWTMKELILRQIQTEICFKMRTEGFFSACQWWHCNHICGLWHMSENLNDSSHVNVFFIFYVYINHLNARTKTNFPYVLNGSSRLCCFCNILPVCLWISYACVRLWIHASECLSFYKVKMRVLSHRGCVWVAGWCCFCWPICDLQS